MLTLGFDFAISFNLEKGVSIMNDRIAFLTIKGFAFFCLVFWSGFGFAEINDTTVKVGLMYDPFTINMLEIKTGVDLPAVLHMHQALQATDPITGERTLKKESPLAESMTVMENGKDIIFKLKAGQRFHNGDPVTAYDIQFTYEECVNPQNANLMSGPLDEIEEIEVIDDHNLIFHFYEPYAAWRELLWIGITSQKYFEKVGRNKFRSHPIGSGPFRFVERKIGEYLLLEAMENHNGFSPDFKRLKFMIVPDEVARIAMLQTGELDLISDILPHNVPNLKRHKHIIVKTESRVPSLFALSGKPDNYPIFKQPNFGQAISRAINRQEIVDRVFLGEGYPMYMFASRTELGYDPDYKVEFDPEEAKRLLKKTTYKPGTPIILTYTSAVPNSALVATIVQRYLKNIGINLTLQNLEAGVQATYSREKNPKEGHMTLYAWAGGRDPSTRLLLTVPSDSIYCAYTTRPNQEEVNAMTYAQARETNPVKRKEILRRLHQILREQTTGSILFGLNMIYAMNERIDYNWLPGESFLFYLHRIKIVK